MKKIIPYGKQFIEKDDIRAVTNALNQEKITTGPLVEKFEKKLSNYTKAKYVLTCNNGTSALYLAFRSIKLKKLSSFNTP